MNRTQFLAGVVAAGAGLCALATRAGATPAFHLAERIQPPVIGDLLQYELGFGAAYGKQIGSQTVAGR